ncbi:peptide deformylase [Novispirillum itersonii]|uniref:Peptide deformylase n=1 Tax=Novispirillum itersonii TaxID=189 RepID=A0A7W9ZG53_NOVIT|nr:peptide deformylase [Novispirillum itersonii]MBB6210463.1 peptide deformylase [Novispirillum itersonii]
MAILKIARMGHPVLRSAAQPVEDPTSPEIRRLVADMQDTLRDAGGVGLAAPQVYVPLRIVIFFAPPDRNNGVAVPMTTLINPVIEAIGDDLADQVEGCLSLPGMAGKVRRPAAVRYRGVDLDNAPVDVQAYGFHARVVQHEVDHLDGILYPMRMTDLTTFGFVEELRKAAAS